MKNITKSIIFSTLLCSSSVYANQETALAAQVNLGAVHTSLNDYSGTGFKASAKIQFPLKHKSVNFYGKLSYQTTRDEKQNNDFYFDETELTLGIAYHINNEHLIFLEGGDIKQSFDNNSQGVWKDYLYVTRLGTQLQQNNFNIKVALEHRDGMNSATGYNTTIGFFENSMRISYTDVGDYQSIGLSFQANF
ncbi:MAG: hypothetical protein HRT53_01725 [Colwellia sp.]|nr:hypothetical protein [Colwellia sp.]